MKTTIHLDGMEGWAKRAKERAKALDERKKIERSKSITFENVGEMARLLTEARLEIIKRVKGHRYPIQDLANILNRDVSAVRKDVNKLEQYGILRSERTTNPGHGIVCIVSAPSSITFTATV